MNILKYCIKSTATILEALKKINESSISMVVVYESKKALGTLTDGDIRRALINGAELSSCVAPYYTHDFLFVGPETLRADVLELMQARLIEQIPIIDNEGVLIGIHTLHTILGHTVKPNSAVIIAGGKGTRLGCLTKEFPKPMLKVAGKPILERIILHLVSHGIKKVFISVNYLADKIEEHFGDGTQLGCRIEYLREDEPLGTGGPISLLPEEAIQAPVVVLNGDLIIEADISQMLKFHAYNDFYATMGVHYYTHEVPFGCVELDENNKMLGIEEKPVLTKIINGGVYVLSPEAIKNIPYNAFFPITDLFKDALDLNRECGVYSLDGDWMDIGLPSQLKEARGNVDL